MTIVVATRNPDKLKEIENILQGLDVELSSLERYGRVGEVVEDGRTIEENALKKARAVRDATGVSALADDTGLEVDALGGAPGVFSARFAGEKAGYEANNLKLLEALEGISEGARTARFRCVMALALSDEAARALPRRVDAFVAEGILEGVITREKRGLGGFGYDPVFEVPGSGKTLAEIGTEGKNRISHRYRALVEIRELMLRSGLAKARD
jgi:XTP/dITP diphosphohydrolase